MPRLAMPSLVKWMNKIPAMPCHAQPRRAPHRLAMPRLAPPGLAGPRLALLSRFGLWQLRRSNFCVEPTKAKNARIAQSGRQSGTFDD
jgi:hypothetical protein